MFKDTAFIIAVTYHPPALCFSQGSPKIDNTLEPQMRVILWVPTPCTLPLKCMKHL